MRQQLAAHNVGDALRRPLRDLHTVHILDAMPKQAQPRKDAAVFANLCRQLPVDDPRFITSTCFLLDSFADDEGLVAELQCGRETLAVQSTSS